MDTTSRAPPRSMNLTRSIYSRAHEKFNVRDADRFPASAGGTDSGVARLELVTGAFARQRRQAMKLEETFRFFPAPADHGAALDAGDPTDGGGRLLLGGPVEVRLRQPGGRALHQAGPAGARRAGPGHRRAGDWRRPVVDERPRHAAHQRAVHRGDGGGDAGHQGVALPRHLAAAEAAVAAAGRPVGGAARHPLGLRADHVLHLPAGGGPRPLVAGRLAGAAPRRYQGRCQPNSDAAQAIAPKRSSLSASMSGSSRRGRGATPGSSAAVTETGGTPRMLAATTTPADARAVPSRDRVRARSH